jgi:magnesium transporter
LIQIFNDEVDAYQSWTLFLIFVSILILISGVVLLTHKKPEPGALPKSAAVPSAGIAMRNRRMARKAAILQAHKAAGGEEDEDGMTPRTGDEGEMLWAVGDVSDGDDDDDDMGEDEDIDHHQHPLNRTPSSKRPEGHPISGGEEGRGLMAQDDEHEEHDHSLTSRRPRSQESPRTPFISIPLSPR